MKRLVIAAPVLFALAACGGEPAGSGGQGGSVSLTNATSEEVAAASSAAGMGQAAFNPGKWETRFEVTSMEMPGMDARMREQMNKMMAGKVTTDSSCMTAEEAKNPRAKMFAGDKKSDCTFRHFKMGGGKIDAEMYCPGSGDRGETVMKMDGTFDAEQYAMNAKADVSGGPQPMSMAIKLSGKRVGECDAK